MYILIYIGAEVRLLWGGGFRCCWLVCRLVVVVGSAHQLPAKILGLTERQVPMIYWVCLFVFMADVLCRCLLFLNLFQLEISS